MLECTLYDVRDSIAWITLNRPDVLNALNRKLWREIYKNLDKAEEDKEARAIIITGNGRAFCAGDDIKEVASLETEYDIRSFFLNYATPTMTKIIELSKPVIAAVNGLAYGGGCEIAMLCDLVVASESATFAVPEALIGAIPPVAVAIGSSLIGRLNVNMMMLTGEPVTAREAKLMGLVNQVVPLKELLTAAERLAKATMQAAPLSIRAIKRLSYKRFRKKDFELAVAELIENVHRGEGKEGHRAFLEKRKPKWVDEAVKR